MTLDELLQRGFDLSYVVPARPTSKRYATTHYHVRCSQCEALVINGVPTHEAGCPNARKARRHRDWEGDSE